MVDDVSPSDPRPRQFDVVRRGYDRAQVDAHIESLKQRIDSLESGIEEARSTVLAVGINDREALANELHQVGDEVAAILEAARDAAEGLRTRATQDADKWRSEAKREADALLADATEQSQSMRAAAWNEGSSLLGSASAEANNALSLAQEEALFMRAEAERDALRLTSDARRDREEAVRAGRQEADSILEEARRESDGVLAAAQKQAEVAQERARALEDRRSELLAELEATRDSISHLEEEIESRRQELETPEPEPEQPPERSSVGDEVGSVKIVAGSRAVSLKPVDPDELVAEVVAMRASSDQAAALAAADELLAEPETVAVISPPHAEKPSPTGPAAQPGPSAEPSPASSPESAVSIAEPSDDGAPSAEPVTSDDEAAAHDSDEIGSLFARLRDPGEPEQAAEPPAPEKTQEEPATEPAKPAEPAELDPVGVDTRSDDVSSPVTPSAEATVLAGRNSALKEVKRALVDLQNEALESLRVDESWLPDDAFTDRFSDGFELLAEAVPDVDAPSRAREFAADLQDAVTTAIEHAREAGQGTRAVASSASKVFRTWRSDEAERRISV